MRIDGEWQPISGFPGYYINEHGTVASSHLRQPVIVLDLSGQASEPEGLVLQIRSWVAGHPNGYPLIALKTPEGSIKTQTVHSLVARAFLGERPPRAHIAHYDGNPLNPHVSNLRWASPSQNAYDKIRHGTHQRGEWHNFSKLSDAQVVEIRELYATGLHYQHELAERYSVSPATIRNIVTGARKTWLGGPLTAVGPGVRKRGEFRTPKASAWPRRMTAENACEIREMYATGDHTQAELGEKYGVDRHVILCITTGKTFKDAGGPLTKLDNLRGLHKRPRRTAVTDAASARDAGTLRDWRLDAWKSGGEIWHRATALYRRSRAGNPSMTLADRS